MPKRSSHILDMARKGAEHRYQELKGELALLLKHFPHVAGQFARLSSVANSGRPAAAGSAKPKRRTLSAKARKAISDAQKARWAKQKAAAKK